MNQPHHYKISKFSRKEPFLAFSCFRCYPPTQYPPAWAKGEDSVAQPFPYLGKKVLKKILCVLASIVVSGLEESGRPEKKFRWCRVGYKESKGTKVQRYKGTKVQRYKKKRYKGTKVQKKKVQRYKGTKVQRREGGRRV
jgi:hypothetical protein